MIDENALPPSDGEVVELTKLLRVIADNRGYAPGFPNVWQAMREAADIVERQQQEIMRLGKLSTMHTLCRMKSRRG